MWPACAAKMPERASGALPNSVPTVPSNRPGVPPSVRMTVSISPVSTLRTLTESVPSPARSASFTDSATVLPTEVATMAAIASMPPAMGSVAETGPDEPSAWNVSVTVSVKSSFAAALIEPFVPLPSEALP